MLDSPLFVDVDHWIHGRPCCLDAAKLRRVQNTHRQELWRARCPSISTPWRYRLYPRTFSTLPVSVASRDQDDRPPKTTIDVYDLEVKKGTQTLCAACSSLLSWHPNNLDIHLVSVLKGVNNILTEQGKLHVRFCTLSKMKINLPCIFSLINRRPLWRTWHPASRKHQRHR